MNAKSEYRLIMKTERLRAEVEDWKARYEAAWDAKQSAIDEINLLRKKIEKMRRQMDLSITARQFSDQKLYGVHLGNLPEWKLLSEKSVLISEDKINWFFELTNITPPGLEGILKIKVEEIRQ